MEEIMISRYLERLGCSDFRTVSKENLFRLQKAHLEKIPYTNLSFLTSGTVHSLEVESLFDRLIIQRKGGYCFELNGLFGELLRSLGYRVTEFFARWHFGGTEEIPMRRHRILRVELDEEIFIADAGIGSLCPTTPLRFEYDMIQPKNSRNYRIVRDPLLGNVVLAETGDGYFPYFSFTEDPHFPQDFIYVHTYCVRQPDSVFRNKLFVHRLTDDIQYQIRNPEPESPYFVYSVRNGDEITEIPVCSGMDMQRILLENFDLAYSLEELPELPPVCKKGE